MVRLLSRIMSMTVLMACIHMDVRHLFASAYYQLPLDLSYGEVIGGRQLADLELR